MKNRKLSSTTEQNEISDREIKKEKPSTTIECMNGQNESTEFYQFNNHIELTENPMI